MKMTRMLRQSLSTSIAFMAMLMLTGCWDRMEIEERAIILGIAVDFVDEGKDPKEHEDLLLMSDESAPDNRLIRITAQIAVPGRIPLGPGEGGSTSGDNQPVWAVSAVGRTIDGAFMSLQQELADRIFLGHLRLVVVSEQYARSGLENLNDFFRRNPQIRRTTWLAVSNGPAEDFMRAKPELERVPTLYLLTMLENAVDLGKYPPGNMGIFWSKLSSDGQEPNLPYIKLKEKDKVMIAGMAVFKGDRMVDITDAIEIGFYMAITNVHKGGYSAYTTVPGSDAVAMFHATDRNASTSMRIVDGKPEFTVAITVEGDILEKTKNHSLAHDHEMIEEIERRLSESAQHAMQQLVEKTQVLGADIFGFGEHVKAHDYAYWKQRVKSKEGWRELYSQININIEPVIKIRRIGMVQL